MVCSLTALFGSSKHNVEMFLELTLPNKIIEQARPQSDFISHFAIRRKHRL
jgi:hypothetical protein